MFLGFGDDAGVAADALNVPPAGWTTTDPAGTIHFPADIVTLPPQKKSAGMPLWLEIGLGLAATAAIGYAIKKRRSR